MNTPQVITGIADRCRDYDLFLVDLWGVVHDGTQAHEAAVHCMRQIRASGATLILISNAPRPSPAVADQIRKLGVPDDAYDGLITSGDATVHALTRRDDADHQALKPHYYHIGPEERSRPLLMAITDTEVPFDAAGYLLNTGVVDDHTETAEQYRDFLSTAAARNLAMLCVNPDRYVMRGTDIHPCAGALADIYEGLGGKVIWHGKPGHLVFDLARQKAAELRVRATLPTPTPSRTIMVGDGLKTDILGANRYGIPSILVADGLLALENPLIADNRIDLECLAGLCAAEKATPDMTMLRFCW